MEKRIFPGKIYLIVTRAACPLAALAVGYAAAQATDDPRAGVRLILLAQCVLIGLLAPFFSSARPESTPIKHVAAAAAKSAGLVAATSIAAVVLSLLLAGSVPVGWILRAGAISLGFAALLAGFAAVIRRLGGRYYAAQFTACLLAGLMLTTVFYANPAVAAGGEVKLAAIRTAVTANPLVSTAGAALDYDILLSRESPVSLYNVSLIGPDHLYRYPQWWAASLIYLAAGIVFTGVSSIGRPTQQQ